MTRQTRFVMVIAAIIALLGLSVVNHVQASEHQWTSLDGPYWANGIDVAYGTSGNFQDWHRYLIGTDGTTKKLFRWRETDSKWVESMPLAPANKLISYKNAGSGHVAVCSAFDDDIYLTDDGGVEWRNLEFPEAFNNSFSSIEIINIDQSPGNTIFVGCETDGSLATTYYTTNAGTNWAKLGGDQGVDPIYGLHVYDIETIGQTDLTAGTNDGLYKHAIGGYGDSWQLVAFSGYDVIALETVDLQNDEQMAAVKIGEDNYKLYYTDDGWASQQEVLINGQSINKEVNDMAGIYWNDPLYAPKSFYLAASDGLFLLTFKGNLQDIVLYDLGSDPAFGYAPIQYDNNFKSVDYYLYTEGSQIHAKVLVSTPFNVYEVHEIRNTGTILDTYSVDFVEVVTGTYMCNITSIRLPRNSQSDKQIIAVSNKGLIKKGTTTEWFLTGLSYLSDGTNFDHVDVATDFEGTSNHDFILATFKNGAGGEVIRSSDGGATWTDVTPQGNNGMVAVDLERGTNNYAYGVDEHVLWVSSDGGLTWDDNDTVYPNTTFRDIAAGDIQWGSSNIEAFAGGEGQVKVYKYDYDEIPPAWIAFDDGLGGNIKVRGISSHFGGSMIYAATDDGVY